MTIRIPEPAFDTMVSSSSAAVAGIGLSLHATSNFAYTSISDNTASTSSYPTIQPNMLDVKCGKDKTFEKHRGNIVLREKVLASVSMYRIMMNMKNKKGKKKVATSIIRGIVNSMVAEHNSLFICFDKDANCWKEISPILARDKVSHAIRTVIRKEDRLSMAASKCRRRNNVVPSPSIMMQENHTAEVTSACTTRQILIVEKNQELEDVNHSCDDGNGSSVADNDDYVGCNEIQEDPYSVITSHNSNSIYFQSSLRTFPQENQVNVVTPSIKPRSTFTFDAMSNDALTGMSLRVPVLSMKKSFDAYAGHEDWSNGMNSHASPDFFTQANHAEIPSEFGNIIDIDDVSMNGVDNGDDCISFWYKANALDTCDVNE